MDSERNVIGGARRVERIGIYYSIGWSLFLDSPRTTWTCYPSAHRGSPMMSMRTQPPARNFPRIPLAHDLLRMCHWQSRASSHIKCALARSSLLTFRSPCARPRRRSGSVERPVQSSAHTPVLAAPPPDPHLCSRTPGRRAL
ncbi:hypothetical protein HYPSUDRAFT_70151 [Hypholoma sublateritium FD-334 SS-4]|uniref:Uncharacterized protein n=1 Tax=Hypholoma sublateritium (strain FD-334 SS-4) TaxID=945553 RepID=A0A0D2NGN6_HYPSF|nr:hypothetical protein HYPSUDRAFT_70151 [Hypholoma sublateritium FD-334 SS-4]